MENQFLNLTEENLDREHLCCIIRSKKPHPGVEAKRVWLRERLREGHVFRKLDAKGVVFIEYAPLETAWVPLEGDNYLYIYCLWVSGEFKGKGYGRQLMEYCLADARAKGKSGVCMLGAEKQKAWLSDQAFAEKYGFETVDTISDGYRLLAISFDGTKPRFGETAKQQTIEPQELTVYYSSQCPYIHQNVELVRKTCEELETPCTLIPVDTLDKAKSLPCVFNNWAIFYRGKVRDGKSAGCRRPEAASEKIRYAYGNQKSGDGQKEISRLTAAGRRAGGHGGPLSGAWDHVCAGGRWSQSRMRGNR